jgi:hypothetical protein
MQRCHHQCFAGGRDNRVRIEKVWIADRNKEKKQAELLCKLVLGLESNPHDDKRHRAGLPEWFHKNEMDWPPN